MLDCVCSFIVMYGWINTLSKQMFSTNRKSNQGNQCHSGNQKNVIEVQRPDMENRPTQQRT